MLEKDYPSVASSTSQNSSLNADRKNGNKSLLDNAKPVYVSKLIQLDRNAWGATNTSSLLEGAQAVIPPSPVSVDAMRTALIDARALEADEMPGKLDELAEMASRLSDPPLNEKRKLKTTLAEAIVTLGPLCDDTKAAAVITTLATRAGCTKMSSADTAAALTGEVCRRMNVYELMRQTGNVNESAGCLSIRLQDISPAVASLFVTSAALRLMLNSTWCKLKIEHGTATGAGAGQSKVLKEAAETALIPVTQFTRTDRESSYMLLERTDESSDYARYSASEQDWIQLKQKYGRTSADVRISYTQLARAVKGMPANEVLKANDPLWGTLHRALPNFKRDYSSMPSLVNVDWARVLGRIKGRNIDLHLTRHRDITNLLYRASNLLRDAEYLSGETLSSIIGALRNFPRHDVFGALLRNVQRLIPPEPSEMLLTGEMLGEFFHGLRHMHTTCRNESNLGQKRYYGAAAELAAHLLPYLRQVSFENPDAVVSVLYGTSALPPELSGEIADVFYERNLLTFSESWKFDNWNLSGILVAVCECRSAIATKVFRALWPHVQHWMNAGEITPRLMSNLLRVIPELLPEARQGYAKSLEPMLRQHLENDKRMTDHQLFVALYGLHALPSEDAEQLAKPLLDLLDHDCRGVSVIEGVHIGMALLGISVLPKEQSEKFAAQRRKYSSEASGHLSSLATAAKATVSGKVEGEMFAVMCDMLANADMADHPLQQRMSYLALLLRGLGPHCHRLEVKEFVELAWSKAGGPSSIDISPDVLMDAGKRLDTTIAVLQHGGFIDLASEPARLDLHGLSCHEHARDVVDSVLDHWKESGSRRINIIYGKGSHGAKNEGKMEMVCFEALKSGKIEAHAAVEPHPTEAELMLIRHEPEEASPVPSCAASDLLQRKTEYKAGAVKNGFIATLQSSQAKLSVPGSAPADTLQAQKSLVAALKTAVESLLQLSDNNSAEYQQGIDALKRFFAICDQHSGQATGAIFQAIWNAKQLGDLKTVTNTDFRKAAPLSWQLGFSAEDGSSIDISVKDILQSRLQQARSNAGLQAYQGACSDEALEKYKSNLHAILADHAALCIVAATHDPQCSTEKMQSLIHEIESASEPAPLLSESDQAMATLVDYMKQHGAAEWLEGTVGSKEGEELTAALARNAMPNGATALHFAARQNNTEAMRMLLDYGACVDAKTVDDKTTPAQWAMKENAQEALALLLNHLATPR